MFVLIEEVEAESPNVYLFTTREAARQKLAELRDEDLDGDEQTQGVNLPDEFYEDSDSYWLHIEEQEAK